MGRAAATCPQHTYHWGISLVQMRCNPNAIITDVRLLGYIQPNEDVVSTFSAKLAVHASNLACILYLGIR